jgi:hypothetical protein
LVMSLYVLAVIVGVFVSAILLPVFIWLDMRTPVFPENPGLRREYACG